MDKSDAEGLRKKLETHKKRLEEFGEVNLLALSEHEELKERHDFLATQIKDLVSAGMTSVLAPVEFHDASLAVNCTSFASVG